MAFRRYRREEPLGQAFGSFVVHELLQHQGERVRRVVLDPDLAQERREPLERRCRDLGVGFEEDGKLLRRAGHRRDIDAYAEFEKYGEFLDPLTDHLVLVRPAGFGNVGTVLCSMLAFGVRDMALVGPALDPFSPHLLRASLGARFAVRIEPFGALEEYAEKHPRALHLFDARGSVALDEAAFPTPWSLVIGPEWPGLSERELALGTTVAIPQSGPVESLNLAVAAGIALYAARRRPARDMAL